MKMNSRARVLTLSTTVAFCVMTALPGLAGPPAGRGPAAHGNVAGGGPDEGNKGGEQRGLDRADQVAGEHGQRGRDNARDKQARSPEPGDKADCKKGGWRNFGFKNEGQCVSHVTSHRP
jgi:hypothetical protein